MRARVAIWLVGLAALFGGAQLIYESGVPELHALGGAMMWTAAWSLLGAALVNTDGER